MPVYETNCFMQDPKYCIGTYVVRADEKYCVWHGCQMMNTLNGASVSVQCSLQHSKCPCWSCLYVTWLHLFRILGRSPGLHSLQRLPFSDTLESETGVFLGSQMRLQYLYPWAVN